MQKLTIIVFFVLILFKGYGQDYSQKWTDVNYVGDGQVYHNLDIYLPKVVKSKYPVVLYIYGSAWQSNSSKTSDMNTVGAALLNAGYAVVSINHRSSSDAIFPAQIQDVKAAIRFVRGNCAKYNFDTCFVGISGSSSGGHLSSLAGTSGKVKTFTVGSATMDIEGSLGSFTKFSSSVNAVCDWFGPMYLLKLDSCGNTTQHGADNSPGSLILGGPIKQNLDKEALLEPKTYIDPTDPPFLIFHGDADNVVPYCASVFFNNDLKAKGVQSEYVQVPGGQHYTNVHTATNFAKMVTFFDGIKNVIICSASPPINVNISSPVNNDVFDSPASIAITASASFSGGTITKVDFYNGATKIGTATSSPYTFTWSNVSSGTYSITAVATNNNNNVATSTAVTVVVNIASVPPTITSPVTYCQNAIASALTATGTALKWYTLATVGIASSIAPVPSTSSVGSTTYYVSQTVGSTESSRAAIIVTITALPVLPTVTATINYIQGAAASALTATGTALKWYTIAIGGTALTASPTPSTATVGTSNYYVSQTTNSCESSRALIAVNVSTPATKISLKAGWNYIGCPITGLTAIASALSSIWPNVVIVKNLEIFYAMANAPALNTLSNVQWGQGYYVKVSTDCDLDWIVR